MEDFNPFSITYRKTQDHLLHEQNIIKGQKYQGLDSLKNMGFQASKLYDAYQILKRSYHDKNMVILAFTSNAISCGLRQLIAKLCKEKLVDCVVTTAGAIEQDMIKAMSHFYYTRTLHTDSKLNQMGINRTENILCPNRGYIIFEQFLNKIGSQDNTIYDTNPIELIEKLSKNLPKCQDSFLYWAYHNKIPVITLAIQDGCIGDHFAKKFYENNIRGLKIPSINCAVNLPYYINVLYRNSNKKTALILGGSTPKHFVMNGLISRGGADSVIYLNNGVETDGSNASATVHQTISWGKSKAGSQVIKVNGDFVFTFTLLSSQLLNDRAQGLI